MDFTGVLLIMKIKRQNTIFKKIVRIKREYGLINYLSGKIRRIYYKMLREKFSFGEWHIEPYELRPYALDIKKYVNKMRSIEKLCVCEVGCGLGDIIRNLKARKRIGIDLSKEAINCARFLDRWGGEYYVGSFDTVSEIAGLEQIDVLITVNFIHNIEPVVLRSYYETITLKTKVRYVILDTIESEGYLYFHNIDFLFPEMKTSTVISSHIVSTGGERRVYLVEVGNLF